MVADGHGLSDGMWWAFMTFTTVGYGDQYPTSTMGRAAGALLVSTAVFLVIPVITAAIISRFEDKTDEWTHEEQEEVKAHLRELIEWKRNEMQARAAGKTLTGTP